MYNKKMINIAKNSTVDHKRRCGLKGLFGCLKGTGMGMRMKIFQ